MLAFHIFDETPEAAESGTLLGRGVRVSWDPTSAMRVAVRRARIRTSGAPSLVIEAHDRAPDDWFAFETDVTPETREIALTARNYPAQRLFPRLYIDRGGRIGHLDLADIAASEGFATHVFDTAPWGAHPDVTSAPFDTLRLGLLVPFSPWFAMEIAAIDHRTLAEM